MAGVEAGWAQIQTQAAIAHGELRIDAAQLQATAGQGFEAMAAFDVHGLQKINRQLSVLGGRCCSDGAGDWLGGWRLLLRCAGGRVGILRVAGEVEGVAAEGVAQGCRNAGLCGCPGGTGIDAHLVERQAQSSHFQLPGIARKLCTQAELVRVGVELTRQRSARSSG